ncbi:POX domain [Macleaya cordata]|uniref:POX domain n=1 Tax=Macleaya cordata TaxID=56857 RepID=A0A200Q294_MACCD|nr:POX domain [Macleaya cordata]
MQMVVNSFDSVMGFGAATPYTTLAQKAMSRHFRCLKDAITSQLKLSCELLGDKEGAAGTSAGVTKGETPRLKLLEQSLRQQRAFNQMGLMEQEAWRPQRAAANASVVFLDFHALSKGKKCSIPSTGTQVMQISICWLDRLVYPEIRVRLWKPMVEEMYQRETKEEDAEEREKDRDQHDLISSSSNNNNNNSSSAQTPMPSTSPPPPPTTIATTTVGKRSEINATENDPSFKAINRQSFSENQATRPIHISPPVMLSSTTTTTTTTSHDDVSPPPLPHFPVIHDSDIHQLGMDDTCRGGIAAADYGTTGTNANIRSTLLRFGTTMGDVSLTLGLRHAGNIPENSRYTVRDFGGC